MHGRFETDLTHFPLVTVTIPGQRVTDEEILRFIDGQREMIGRRTKHLLLCDARAGHVAPATQRKMFGDWLKEAEEGTRRYTAGMAVVVDNSLIRGALTAVLWVVEPACPTKIVATMDDAITFLTECGERANIPDVRTKLDAARTRRRSA